ncbi:hypothetical protein [Aeromonas salmonicida]|uniref:hypothetical protein n=1 Tax=Aeromonas salmonicida TaxID=645 RepID=UPI003D2072D7
MSDDWHKAETYKSLIAISIEGFKFCALANGGAAVAILAYLGNVAGKGRVLPDMAWPMVFFSLGLGACGAAVLCSYLTQLQLYDEERRSVPESDRKHLRYLHCGLLCVAASIVLFVVGSMVAVCKY